MNILLLFLASLDAGAQSDLGTSVSELGKQLEPAAEHWRISGGKIMVALVVFVVAALLIRYVSMGLEAVAERWTRFRLQIKRGIPVLRISAWIVTLYAIIVGVFAPPVQTLVAATASAGIAIGFAAQDILKNIFGGVMILFDHPFQVGDKIQVGEHYGEVLQIGLRTVRIVTPDDSIVSLPNSEIVKQPVSNANTGQCSCMVGVEVYLPLDVPLDHVRELARRSALVSRYILPEKPVIVTMQNELSMGRSLIKLKLKAYVQDLRYEFAFASDMTETLLVSLREEGMLPDSELPAARQAS